MSTSKADSPPQTEEPNGNFKHIPSSDDEETGSLHNGKKEDSDNDIHRPPDSDNSEDERFKRADIRRGDWGSKKPDPAISTTKSTQNRRLGKRTTKKTIYSDSNSPTNSKRDREEEEEEDHVVRPGARMKELMDFTHKSSQQPKQKKGPQKVYGAGRAHARPAFGFTRRTFAKMEIQKKKALEKSEATGSSHNLSSERLKELDDDDSDVSLKENISRQGLQDTLKVLEGSDNDNSPQKPQSFFKSLPPGLDSPQSASPWKRIKSGDRKSQRRKEPQDSDDDRPKLKALPPDLEVADTSPLNISPAPSKNFKDMKSSPASVPNTVLNHIPDSVRKMAAKDGYSEILQDLDDSMSFAASPTSQYSPELNEYPKKKSQAVCPMCDEPVDIADLKAWGTMNAQRQAKFCRSHKKKAVKDNWNSRGYPEIDWENLDSRIAQHHSFIRSLINGTSSHFGDLLNEAVKSGKRRSIKDMISYTSPGYYGTRGLSAISDNINAKFSLLLKQRAVEYRLISARGRSTFVQAVLVPEVACRLIKDDMNVPIEKARVIMKDSIEDGDLVNEEVKDKIVIRKHDSDEEDDTYEIR